MIIKQIKRKPGERSRFEQLGRYILNAKSNDPIMFTRTAEYVMDLKGDGEKVAWYRITNCESEAPAVAIAEILTTQAENHRTRSDKTYHLVVSLPHWEQLTRDVAADIEDTICAGLGLAEHQRVSAVHQDTEHSHLHIAINKIHPTTFRCVEPYYQYYKLDRLAKELEVKHGLHQDNRIGQGKHFSTVGQMEAHQQEESFLRWLRENLGGQLNGILENAKEWQDMHAFFAAYGAIVKPRGAGLAIVTMDGKTGIKASSLDRKLSFKTLTDRFGEYQPPKFHDSPRKHYKPNAAKHAEASTLFADYQKRRQANYEARSSGLADSRRDLADKRMKLKERYRQRRNSVKANTEMDNRTKRMAYSELSQEMKKDMSEITQLQQSRRTSIRAEFPALTWDQYLTNTAEQGNVDALAILRKRQSCRRQICQALLTVETFEEARDIIKPHFKPTVLKNGKVIYRADDGGVVFDEATAISVQHVTEASTLLALSLADERFAGKAVVVEGTDEFRFQVARLSALGGLSVRFADPVLEKDRQRHVRAKELSHQELKETMGENNKQPERDSGQYHQQR